MDTSTVLLFTALLRGVLLVVGAGVWLAYLLVPLLMLLAQADIHQLGIHAFSSNLIYTLIGINYVGGLYAASVLHLTGLSVWVFVWLVVLAFWY